MEQTATQTGYFDNFSQLLTGYFQWRTAEAQADASGASQAQAAQTTEHNTAIQNQTMTASEYAGIGATIQNMDTNKLLVGGVLILGLIWVIKGRK